MLVNPRFRMFVSTLETQLDDVTLMGAAWPPFAARWHAWVALGSQPPETPQVWDASCGWRWLRPGD
jgi:hypothetical protein